MVFAGGGGPAPEDDPPPPPRRRRREGGDRSGTSPRLQPPPSFQIASRDRNHLGVSLVLHPVTHFSGTARSSSRTLGAYLRPSWEVGEVDGATGGRVSEGGRRRRQTRCQGSAAARPRAKWTGGRSSSCHGALWPHLTSKPSPRASCPGRWTRLRHWWRPSPLPGPLWWSLRVGQVRRWV